MKCQYVHEMPVCWHVDKKSTDEMLHSRRNVHRQMSIDEMAVHREMDIAPNAETTPTYVHLRTQMLC
jgi:hypothetical protein